MADAIESCVDRSAHSFQMTDTPSMQMAIGQKRMMYCTRCGSSYIFGSDGNWHHVQFADSWETFFGQHKNQA